MKAYLVTVCDNTGFQVKTFFDSIEKATDFVKKYEKEVVEDYEWIEIKIMEV